MELGNAPFIVFDDADIEMAVKGAIASKYPIRKRATPRKKSSRTSRAVVRLWSIPRCACQR